MRQERDVHGFSMEETRWRSLLRCRELIQSCLWQQQRNSSVFGKAETGPKGWKPSFLLLLPANLPGEAGGSCGSSGKALAGPISAKLLGLVGQDLALVLCGAVSCRAQA